MKDKRFEELQDRFDDFPGGISDDEVREFLHELRSRSMSGYTMALRMLKRRLSEGRVEELVPDLWQDEKVEEQIRKAVIDTAGRTEESHESERVWREKLERIDMRLRYRSTVRRWVERIISVMVVVRHPIRWTGRKFGGSSGQAEESVQREREE